MSAEAAPTTEQAPSKPWSLLAAETFGSNFKGEVKQPPPPEPAAPEAPAAEIEQAPVAQESAPEQPEQETEQADAKPISSVNELIEQNQYDPEWFNTLKVPVKINGEAGEATLAELTKSYQIQQAAEKRLEEAKAKAKAETQAIAERRDQLNAQYAAAAGLIDQAEKFLTRDEQAVNWQQLREQDPAEWTAKKAEFQARRDEINKLKNDAITSYQRAAGMSKQEQEVQQQQYLQQQSELLTQKLADEWKDPEVAKQEKQEIASFLVNAGLSPEEIGAVSDHRLILIARKAMLFDRGQSKADLVKNKVKTIPKVLKPGAPKSPDQLNRAKVQDAKSRLTQTGSLDDALAVLRSKRG